MYKRIDDRYIKPWMLRENHSIKDPKIIETYMHLTETEALKLIKDGKLPGSSTFTQLSTLDLNGSSSGDQSQKASVSNVSTIQGGEVDPHNAEYRQTQEDMEGERANHGHPRGCIGQIIEEVDEK